MLNQFLLANGAIDARPMLLGGPIIQLEIGVPSALAQQLSTSSQPIPQPQAATALIDTGASTTCVDLDVLAALSLAPTGQTNLATPSDPSANASIYPVRLTFPQIPGVPLAADPINVIGCPLKGQGVGALLGRDFLLNAVLVYNGPGGFYTLAF